MKKWTAAFILFIAVFMMSNCASLTEEYRFKKRYDKFYNFLSQDERSLLLKKDFQGLGISLDNRTSQNKELSAEWDAIKDGEAISTFSSSQSADFFYTILLREVNRENFRDFMDLLSAEEQFRFAMGQDYRSVLMAKLTVNKKFEKFIDKCATEYRLYGASPEQIFDFFFEVSYPEISRRQFYNFCIILKKAEALPAFIAKDLDSVSRSLDKYSKEHPLFIKDIKTVKEKAALKNLTDSQLATVYNDIAFRQMDRNAALKTMGKFINMGPIE